MQVRPQPSEELDVILRQLRPYCGAVEVTLPGASFDTLVQQLGGIRRLMISLEHEAGALRLAEAAREGRAIVDKLASDQFHSMVVDPTGKVIRPDFGGRS